MELAGMPAIVTGGASGLGLATARLLTKRGCRVALFDANADLVHEAATAIGASPYIVDVANEESVESALADHQNRFGVARILLNAAGIADIVDILEPTDSGVRPYPLDRFRRVIDVNLTGSFNCLRLFAARLAGQQDIDGERGIVINVSSIAGLDSAPRRSAYVSSKAAIAALTLSAARDLAEHHIRVAAIAPGLFRTPILGDDSSERYRAAVDEIPHPRRLGEAAEFAAAVEFVCTNGYVNGTTIRVDGAWVVGGRLQ